MDKKRFTKEDIINTVCNDTYFPKAIVSEVISSTLDAITSVLSHGDEVHFAGFGSFRPVQRAARTGRNLHQNTPVPIPPRVVPVFKAGKALKDAVIKEERE